jgi:hypothetical protein
MLAASILWSWQQCSFESAHALHISQQGLHALAAVSLVCACASSFAAVAVHGYVVAGQAADAPSPAAAAAAAKASSDSFGTSSSAESSFVEDEEEAERVQQAVEVVAEMQLTAEQLKVGPHG